MEGKRRECDFSICGEVFMFSCVKCLKTHVAVCEFMALNSNNNRNKCFFSHKTHGGCEIKVFTCDAFHD